MRVSEIYAASVDHGKGHAAIAHEYGITIKEVQAALRLQKAIDTRIRYARIYLYWKQCRASKTLAEIGEAFGVSEATVSVAIDYINTYLDRGPLDVGTGERFEVINGKLNRVIPWKAQAEPVSQRQKGTSGNTGTR